MTKRQLSLTALVAACALVALLAIFYRPSSGVPTTSELADATTPVRATPTPAPRNRPAPETTPTANPRTQGARDIFDGFRGEDYIRRVALSGRVMTEAGDPIPGARVSLHLRSGAPALLMTESNSEGLYKLGDIPAGTLLITAMHPAWGEKDPEYIDLSGSGRDPVGISKQALSVGAPHERNIVLGKKRDGIISGIVVDKETELPISGATVRFIHRNSRIIRETISNNEGLFFLTDLDEGWSGNLFAGRRDKTVGYVNEAKPQDDPVVLRVGGVGTVVWGSVTISPNHEILSDVSVEFSYSSGIHIRRVAIASTDGNGRYRTEWPIPSGTYDILTVANISQLNFSNTLELGRFQSGELQFDISFPQSTRIEGRIVEQGSLRPVEGVLISSGPQLNNVVYPSFQPVTTDHLGRFAFDYHPSIAKFLGLSSSKDGYSPSEHQFREIVLDGGNIRLDDIEITPANQLKVVVLNQDGQPVPDAKIRIYNTEPNDFHIRFGHLISDASGQLTVDLRPFSEAREVIVFADTKDGETGIASVVWPLGVKSQLLSVEVSKGVELTLRPTEVNEEHYPIRVHFSRLRIGDVVHERHHHERLLESPQPVHVLKGVVGDGIQIKIQSAMGPLLHEETLDLAQALDGRLDVAFSADSPTDSGESLFINYDLKFVDEDGNPVANVEVQDFSSANIRHKKSDENGRINLRISRSAFHLYFLADGFERDLYNLDRTTKETDISKEVTLKRLRWVRAVLQTDGNPLSKHPIEVSTSIKQEDGSWYTIPTKRLVYTSDLGVIDFLYGRGYDDHEQTILFRSKQHGSVVSPIIKGGNDDIDLGVLEMADTSVAGYLYDVESEERVSGAIITLLPLQMNQYLTKTSPTGERMTEDSYAETDARGAFSFSDLPSREILFHVFHPNYGRQSITPIIDENDRLMLGLMPPVRLRGSILYEGPRLDGMSLNAGVRDPQYGSLEIADKTSNSRRQLTGSAYELYPFLPNNLNLMITPIGGYPSLRWERSFSEPGDYEWDLSIPRFEIVKFGLGDSLRDHADAMIPLRIVATDSSLPSIDVFLGYDPLRGTPITTTGVITGVFERKVPRGSYTMIMTLPSMELIDRMGAPTYEFPEPLVVDGPTSITLDIP